MIFYYLQWPLSHIWLILRKTMRSPNVSISRKFYQTLSINEYARAHFRSSNNRKKLHHTKLYTMILVCPNFHKLFIYCFEKRYFRIDKTTSWAKNSAAFYALYHPFTSMQLKYLTLFLLQGYQPITIKGLGFSQFGNNYTPQCSSSVESLLCWTYY